MDVFDSKPGEKRAVDDNRILFFAGIGFSGFDFYQLGAGKFDRESLYKTEFFPPIHFDLGGEPNVRECCLHASYRSDFFYGFVIQGDSLWFFFFRHSWLFDSSVWISPGKTDI